MLTFAQVKEVLGLKDVLGWRERLQPQNSMKEKR
jgi:hypothetical protein